MEAHNHEALIYLSTLLVADPLLWKGLETVLEDGEESETKAG